MIKRGAVVLMVMCVAACSGHRGAEGGGAAGVPVDSLATTVEVRVAGGEVHLILHVTNPTRRAIRLEFPTSQRYDFEVRSGGMEVWRWSSGHMFNQAVGTETVAAGGSVRYDAVWRPGNRTGQFTAVGRLATSGVKLEKQTVFEIPGG